MGTRLHKEILVPVKRLVSAVSMTVLISKESVAFWPAGFASQPLDTSSSIENTVVQLKSWGN